MLTKFGTTPVWIPLHTQIYKLQVIHILLVGSGAQTPRAESHAAPLPSHTTSQSACSASAAAESAAVESATPRHTPPTPSRRASLPLSSVGGPAHTRASHPDSVQGTSAGVLAEGAATASQARSTTTEVLSVGESSSEGEECDHEDNTYHLGGNEVVQDENTNMYPEVPFHKFDPFEVRKKKRYPDTPAFILCQESCNDNMGISFQFASDVKILLKIERYFQAEALGMLSGMKFDSIKADNGSGWVKPPPRFAPLLQDASKEYPQLIASYTRQARNPRYVASGGKNLRMAGWNAILVDFKEHGIITAAQLQSKWRRLKADWTDYGFLKNMSGYGEGLTDEKWNELDATKGKLKLSRFKDKPFVHWDTMSAVIGDTMASSELISSLDESLANANEVSSAGLCDDDESELSEAQLGDLSAAQKRAKVLYQLKKNRKRKAPQESDPARDLRMKTLMDIPSSLGNLVKLYAAKNDLSSVLEEKSLP
ncbi:hypothetical protein AeMF1_005569 [Aphanomyces euteiches]|nr:hypothetical protein AeMF1_005569 [Aphanomyces euteiches]KAH9183759.1 hypothetical protein AeNC1_014266 [Aphanomyces euteiches]